MPQDRVEDERASARRGAGIQHERPRTALVAGGTGALGRGVVAVLLERGEQVCVPWIVEAEASQLRVEHADALTEGRLR
ncbi:MAG: hypothetical protein ACRDU8_03895, partial [Egibacteraceae bacterium]